MPTSPAEDCLFGGILSWDSADWTASDDRVRGGKSQSYMHCSKEIAKFHGDLDIETLGGAGFASQRTTGEAREWDLSQHDGIVLDMVDGDDKRYTFILKDTLLPRDPNTGREQSTISYEYDFYFGDTEESGDGGRSLFIPWKAFKATYRGRDKDNAPAIDLKHVKRVSIMNRSFFGDQQGKFSLSLRSIKATSSSPNGSTRNTSSNRGSYLSDESTNKPPVYNSDTVPKRWYSWLFSCFNYGPR